MSELNWMILLAAGFHIYMGRFFNQNDQEYITKRSLIIENPWKHLDQQQLAIFQQSIS